MYDKAIKNFTLNNFTTVTTPNKKAPQVFQTSKTNQHFYNTLAQSSKKSSQLNHKQGGWLKGFDVEPISRESANFSETYSPTRKIQPVVSSA